MTKIKNLFNISKTIMLSRSDKKDYAVFMEPITEEMEHNFDKQLDYKNKFTYKTIKGYVVNNSSVYLYGEINLDNKNDIKYLDKFKKAILNPYDTCNWYYSTFDYESGTITYNEDRKAFIGNNFVTNYIAWFKQQYCKIGKPKRIIIYKIPIPKHMEYD